MASMSAGAGPCRMTRHIHEYVSRGYDSGSDIIRTKNYAALELVARHLPRRAAGPLRVIDLGVGDGAFLRLLNALGGEFHYTGVDIAQSMLDLAGDAMPLTAIRSRVDDVDRHTQPRSYDLVVAHFILAYVGLDTVLAQARRLLAPGGMLSLVTSTNESAAALLAQVRRLQASRHPGKLALSWAVRRGLSRTHTPDSLGHIRQRLAAHRLHLIDHRRLEAHIQIDDPDEAFRWAVDHGWCVNALDYPLPMPLLTAIARAGLRLFHYPYHSTHVVEVMMIGLD